MEEENKDNKVETVEETPEVKSDPTEIITNMFTELLAEMKTINQTLNNLNPVSEDPPVEEEKPEDDNEGPDTLNGTTEPTEEEIKEADRLLQED